MRDLVVKSAIDLFGNSRVAVGQGPISQLTGDRDYINRYMTIGWPTWCLLFDYYFHDRIAFAPMPVGLWGGGGRAFLWWFPFIRVATSLKTDLVAVSLTLVHEGIHHLRTGRETVEDEVLCRTFETLYYRELRDLGVDLAGKKYHAPTAGGPDDFYFEHEVMSKALAKGRLVDVVVWNSNYVGSLTAKWIRRTLSWWGGASNRSSETQVRYLRVLQREGTGEYLDTIVQILESARNLNDVVREVGNTFWPEFLRVGRANPIYAARTATLEQRWKLSAAQR